MKQKSHPALIELPYQPDSSPLMLALSALPFPVFLDSGMNSDGHGRYDILMADPLATLTQESGCIRIHESDRQRVFTDGDVFTATETLLHEYTPAEETGPDYATLPFTGGAAGFFSYDLALTSAPFSQTSDREKEKAAEDIKVPDAFIGIYTWVVVIDHEQRRSLLLLRDHCDEGRRQRVLTALDPVIGGATDLASVPDFSLKKPFRARTSRDQYQSAFTRLKDYIDAGDCYQANLAQCFTSEYEGDPLAGYLHLRRLARSPFSAYVGVQGGAVLSFSPERFIQVRGAQVLTQPIKGTRRRDADPERDDALASELLSSEKDRAENLMIVDLLRNDLGTLCETGSVRTAQLFELQSFSTVHHLVSTITGRLPPDRHPLALLRNCFPGGSITGAPKIRAMQIIAELEREPRRVYCGSIAYMGFNGQMDTSIAIRTLLCEQGRISCWGGGGIVADSIAEQEYQECLDKISMLIGSLPVVSKQAQAKGSDPSDWP